MVAFVLGIVLALTAAGAALGPTLAIGVLAPLIVARGPWRYIGWLAIGVLWASAYTAASIEARPPAAFTGGERTLTGRVVGLPERAAGRQRFPVVPSHIEGYPADARLPRLVRLSWYGPAPTVRAGEVWRWHVRLRRPRGHLNPGVFDYERWLFGGHVDATGYVRAPGGERLRPASGLPSVRARLAGAIGERLGVDRAAAVIAALTVGDTRGFSDDFWETLRRTGTTHLMVISGLHIGVVSFFVYALVRWLWRRGRRLSERCPAPVAAAVLALAGAGGYAVLAGFGLSTRRALIMLAVVLGGIVARRGIGRSRGLAIAAVAVLALDPAAAVTPGFWLSFGAVAVILLSAAGAPVNAGRRGLAIRIQLALALGLAPFLAAWFGAVPALSAAVNLIVVPLFGVFVPATLGGLALAGLWPDAGWALLGLLHDLLTPVLAGLEAVSRTMGARLLLPAPPWWANVVSVAGAVVLLLPRGTPGRWAGIPMLTAVLVAGVARPLNGHWRMAVLDVGQGLSVVVETRRHTLVYDTGPAWRTGDAARYSLVPYLRGRDIERVDRVMVSHADRDHAGGLGTLLDAVAVDSVRSGEPLSGVPAARGCVRGRVWRWDGVRFEVLWPPPDAGLTGNAGSCVLVIRGVGGSALLAGDITAAVERRMLASGTVPAVDVLVVPHHGSDSSSSPSFVRATAPTLAVLSAGYRNRYGLPDPAVLRRYRCIGARILSTAHDGALVIRTQRSGIAPPIRQRRHEGRLFHEPESRRFQARGQIHYDSCTR